MDKHVFKGMIFEGGGPAGVGHVGALKVFEEKGFLEHIKYFVGSSAGAIAAGALACGGKVNDLRDILMDTDFNDFMDTSACFVGDMRRFVKHFGWYRGDRLYEWYGKVLERLTGNPDITFGEVYERYGNYLVVTVTDVNKGKTLYLNHENSFDMKIRLAVKRSSIIPLIFKTDHECIPINSEQEKKKKHYYTDGGLLNNYPIRQLDHILEPHEVVGFRLMSTRELSEMNNKNLMTSNNPPSNVIEYILLLFTMLRNQALRIHIEEEDWCRTVKIDVGSISGTDFDLSQKDKEFLIVQGRIGAEKFLATYDPEKIYDLHYQKNQVVVDELVESDQ